MVASSAVYSDNEMECQKAAKKGDYWGHPRAVMTVVAMGSYSAGRKVLH
jgi:hypothetical protein